MIRIAHNLDAVIRRAETAARRFEVAVVKRASAITPWRETMRGALTGVMTPAEWPMIPDIMARLARTLEAEIPRLTLNVAADVSQTGVLASGLRASQSIQSITSPEDEAALSLRIENAEEAVRRWVTAPFTGRDDPASGKDLTAEDAEPTELLVERILTILGFRPLAASARDSEERKAAAAGLARRIEAFLAATDGEQQSPGITAARMREILAAVLVAWLELAMGWYRSGIHQDWRNAWGRT